METRDFTALRPLLFATAYRMLGSATDAEDAVQEVWLRSVRARDEVREPRAWLLHAITNVCLDELRSARVRREVYAGPWLPEPVLTGDGVADDPLAAVERRELLSLGALRMLERLGPAERAVLVLREGVGLRHAEIARAVGVSEANSRTLLARARRHLAGPPRQVVERAALGRFLAALVSAFDTDRVGPLIELLREDVVLVTDGGGEVLAARRPILGRDRVLRFFMGVRDRVVPDRPPAIAGVNGEPGLVVHTGGDLGYVLTLTTAGDGRIAEILVVIAPGKLGYARRQLVTFRRPAPSLGA